jgi:hypothetical protein
MTDDTGLFQHARLAQPDPQHGYCVDDNARALITAVRFRAEDLAGLPLSAEQLVNRYLTFVCYAVSPDTQRIRNFMGYDRRWLEPIGSNDAQGRTLWALGVAAGEAPLAHQRALSAQLFRSALPGTAKLDSLRSWAFLIHGLDAWLGSEAGRGDDAAAARFQQHAEQLAASYHAFTGPAWPWWEPTVTYDNARLPLALLLAGRRLQRSDYTDIGLQTLGWLLQVQTDPEHGHLSVIGNDGWYRRDRADERPARYDQQPLEAAALVEACTTAYRVTGEQRWRDHATRCFAWFHGENDPHLSLIHPETGGCQDGLTPHGVNRNQGAESLLAYLMSVQALAAMQAPATQPLQAEPSDPSAAT